MYDKRYNNVLDAKWIFKFRMFLYYDNTSVLYYILKSKWYFTSILTKKKINIYSYKATFLLETMTCKMITTVNFNEYLTIEVTNIKKI